MLSNLLEIATSGAGSGPNVLENSGTSGCPKIFVWLGARRGRFLK
jgi:hypothetical protein